MASSVTMRGQEWVDQVLRGLMGGFDSPGGHRLANQLEEILGRHLRDYRRRGLTNEGQTQEDIKESTERGRAGGGPPIAPRLEESRVVRLLETDQEVTHDQIRVTAEYPADFQRILDILAAGKPPLAGPRPTSGVPRQARVECAQAVAGIWWFPEGLPKNGGRPV